MGSQLPFLVTEIEAYARIQGFTDDLRFFFRCMAAMDEEHFKIEQEKAKHREAAAPPPKGKQAPRRPRGRRR